MNVSLRAPWWHHAALAGLGLIYIVHAAGFGDWLIDDAGITYAYSDRLARGLPLAINAGDPPTEGYSNPSWTFLVAILYALGLFSVPLTPKLLGGAFVLATMVLSWWTTRRAFGDEDGPQHLVAPALMAIVATFVQWSMSGLENAFYSFSMVAALAAHIHERDRPGGRFAGVLPGLLAFLVTLGRPEGIGYAVVLGVDRVVASVQARSWRPLVGWALAFGAPMLGYRVWHALTFLDPVANTYYAKMPRERGLSVFLDFNDGGNRYVRGAFTTYGLLWAPLAALMALASPRRWLQSGGVAFAGMVGVAIAFGIFAGEDWMPGHRLMTPVYPLVGMAAAAGFTLVPGLPRNVRRALPLLALLYTAVWVPQNTQEAWKSQGMKLLVQLKTLDAFAKIATVLDKKPLVVGLADLGGPSMTTDERFVLIDMFGLVDRTVAHGLFDQPTKGHQPLWDYFFVERRADVARFVEPVWKRWGLRECATFQQDWWLIATADTREPPRAGTWIRKDLVEGSLPPGVPTLAASPGVEVAARLDGEVLRVWWRITSDQAKLPEVKLRWVGPLGEAVRTDNLRAFDAAFTPALFRAGRTFAEVVRTARPDGATGFELAPIDRPAGETPATAPPTRPAAAAVAPAPASPADGLVPNGDFATDADWLAIPKDAPGWAIEGEGPDRALRLTLDPKGPIVCTRWGPIPATLDVSARIQLEGVERGKKTQRGAAMTLRIKTKDGQQVFPNLGTWDGTSDWHDVKARYEAQPGQTEYRLCFGSSGAESGTLRVDDVRVR